MIIKEYYFSPVFKKYSKWKGYTFQQESYSKWAAGELIRELSANPNKPPLDIVEDFRDRMNEYSLVNVKTSYMFSVAYDVAENVIDLLITNY